MQQRFLDYKFEAVDRPGRVDRCREHPLLKPLLETAVTGKALLIDPPFKSSNIPKLKEAGYRLRTSRRDGKFYAWVQAISEPVKR